MCAKPVCVGAKMSAAVSHARDRATKLIQRESRGPGDTENAMRRLEARYGIPWRTFWSLRYRPPSDLFVSVYQQLWAAYQAECERQERLMRHELEIARRVAPLGDPAVAAAAAALGGVEGNKTETED